MHYKQCNFDFIERYDSSSSVSKLSSSLHCLNLFYQSTHSSDLSIKKAKCDFCSNSLSPRYCLTSGCISENQPRQLHQPQHLLTTSASCSTSSHTFTSASSHVPSVNLIKPQFKMPKYQPLVHPSSLINKLARKSKLKT